MLPPLLTCGQLRRLWPMHRRGWLRRQYGLLQGDPALHDGRAGDMLLDRPRAIRSEGVGLALMIMMTRVAGGIAQAEAQKERGLLSSVETR